MHLKEVLQNRRYRYSVWSEKRYTKSPFTRRHTVYRDAFEERLDLHISYIDRVLAR